jgi:pimeloyl-ACP methyl ester carboxylesterase
VKPRCAATVLRLEDDRRLAFADFGDSGGQPVFGFHGTPGSALQLAGLEGAAHAAGVRCIVPDRPGYGFSDFQPGRRLPDWPGDVLAIADFLGLGRFGVFGVSGGGPHAAVCAHGIGRERLLGACIVSGVGPVGDPAASEGAMPINRAMFGLARRSPRALRLLTRVLMAVMQRLGEHGFDRMVRRMPEADQRVIAENPGLRAAFVDDAGRASRTASRAMAQDMTLFAQPWGFELEEIGVPVHLWQGDQDVNVPASHARIQAERIPDATLHECPGEAHLLFLAHAESILRAAAGKDRAGEERAS